MCDELYDEYLNDEFYTGRPVRYRRRRKKKHESRGSYTPRSYWTTWKQRHIEETKHLPNVILQPLQYNEAVYPYRYSKHYRHEHYHFRCGPIVGHNPLYDYPKCTQFYRGHGKLREKWQEGWDHRYLRRMRTTQAIRDSAHYSRFYRGKRSVRNIPDSWDDFCISCLKSTAKPVSWKRLSKLNKQWKVKKNYGRTI